MIGRQVGSSSWSDEPLYVLPKMTAFLPTVLSIPAMRFGGARGVGTSARTSTRHRSQRLLARRPIRRTMFFQRRCEGLLGRYAKLRKIRSYSGIGRLRRRDIGVPAFWIAFPKLRDASAIK